MATKRPAKKAATKKRTAPKPPEVTFESDIPRIVREGSGRRTSKYDKLLEAVQERAQAGKPSVATLTLVTPGQATSRYQSLRQAIDRREDADQWTVTTRTIGPEDIRVYVQWNESEN